MENQVNRMQSELNAPPAGGIFSVDLKRILFRALHYWYFIAVTVLVALAIAYLHNRYATRIYPVTASIIVKEAGDLSGAEFVYANPLAKFKRNYLNETYILKSYPLMQSVVEELNFDVSFFQEGDIITTEAYGEVPVSAIPIRSRTTGACRFLFTILSDSTFVLQSTDETESVNEKVFSFSDTVLFEGFVGVFNSQRSDRIKNFVNQGILVHYTPSSLVADRYVKALKAEWAEEGAGVVDLSINGPIPKKSKDFLTGLINKYQDADLENKNQTAFRTVAFISKQLEGISDSLLHVEEQLERFKSKNVVSDLSGEAMRLYQKLEILEKERAQLQVHKTYYKYLLEYLQKDNDLDQIILPSSVGIIDPILNNLIGKMTDLQLELRLSLKKENPLVQDARKVVDEMKQDILESIRNQEFTSEIQNKHLSKQIAAVEGQLGSLPLTERTLISIRRNYTLLENLYIFLLQKRSEAAITQAANTSDIILVNPPISGASISPKSRFNYMLALTLGLALPIFCFFLVEVFNNKVQSKEEIEKLTSIPFIGGVGHKKGKNNLEVLTSPKTSIAESFRALRSNLNYFLGKKEKGVFLVTSSISGEGKTFTTINLASILALSGKRTLIVGADMRRPKIFNDFELANDKGLSTYLAGLGEFDEIVQRTMNENLDVVSGGPVPPNPSELLLTPRLASFLDEAKARYDFLIFDTPPLAIVADAFVLAPYADHTLFLIRQNYTHKELLKTAEDFYTTGKLKDISIVLNDISHSGPGYGYGYGYSYGYSYGYGYSGKNGYGYYDEK